MDEHGTDVWASDAWRERAVAWLDKRLDAPLEYERSGDLRIAETPADAAR